MDTCIPRMKNEETQQKLEPKYLIELMRRDGRAADIDLHISLSSRLTLMRTPPQLLLLLLYLYLRTRLGEEDNGTCVCPELNISLTVLFFSRDGRVYINANNQFLLFHSAIGLISCDYTYRLLQRYQRKRNTNVY